MEWAYTERCGAASRKRGKKNWVFGQFREMKARWAAWCIGWVLLGIISVFCSVLLNFRHLHHQKVFLVAFITGNGWHCSQGWSEGGTWVVYNLQGCLQVRVRKPILASQDCSVCFHRTWQGPEQRWDELFHTVIKMSQPLTKRMASWHPSVSQMGPSTFQSLACVKLAVRLAWL